MATLLINMIVSPKTNNLIEFTSNPSDMGPRSCDACRKRKIKCDRKTNFCSQCFKNGTRCTYNDPIRKRGRPAKLNVDMMKPYYLSPKFSTPSSLDECDGHFRAASTTSSTPSTMNSSPKTFEKHQFTLPSIHYIEQQPFCEAVHTKDSMSANDLSKYSLNYQPTKSSFQYSSPRYYIY